MKVSVLSLAAVIAAGVTAFSAQSASAATYAFIAPYGAPGTNTNVLAINNAGYMTGAIVNADTSGVGFIRDPLGNYTTFTDNGDFSTTGRAIDSSNNITGYSTDNTLNLRTDTQFERAAGGAITVLTNPNMGGANLHGIAQGINSAGAIVGDYFFVSSGHTYRHGYILSGGALTDLSVSPISSMRTLARGITDSGVVDGWTQDTTTGVIQGFIYSGGTFSFVTDPSIGNTGVTYLEGINNNGLAVGQWVDAAANFHPFIYNILTNIFTELHPPTGISFQSFGINDLGEVVLTDTNNPNVNYLYNPLGVGVPEPAAWAMMLIGFAGVGAAVRGRRGALATA